MCPVWGLVGKLDTRWRAAERVEIYRKPGKQKDLCRREENVRKRLSAYGII